MKQRKNLNISLQSKRYNQKVNEILANWDEEGMNLSTAGCEAIIQADLINSSPTLKSAVSAFKFIQQLQSVNIDAETIEAIAARFIKVDEPHLRATLLSGGKVSESQVESFTLPAQTIEQSGNDYVAEPVRQSQQVTQEQPIQQQPQFVQQQPQFTQPVQQPQFVQQQQPQFAPPVQQRVQQPAEPQVEFDMNLLAQIGGNN